ncbi:hypothetical protein LINGRAHAP2_LOCUS14912 [Linum grandiflorum]
MSKKTSQILGLSKVFHNILPLQETLADRGITNILCCPVCGTVVESVFHLLSSFTVAKQLGTIFDCNIFLLEVHPIALWRRLNFVNPRLSYKLIYLRWRLRKAKNMVVFEHYQMTIPNLSRHFTKHWAEVELILVHGQSQLPPVSTTSPSIQLFTPANPTWCFSVDATVSTSKTSGGIGMVVMDTGGMVKEAT